jgi:hypothetical protein
VEDHHVDRPEVEAEQSAQPTGTNRSNPPDPMALSGISRGQPENRRRAAASAIRHPAAVARQTLPLAAFTNPPADRRPTTPDGKTTSECCLAALLAMDAAGPTAKTAKSQFCLL